MALSGRAFVKQIHEMVRSKHSKNHPVVEMIEKGGVSRKQLKARHAN